VCAPHVFKNTPIVRLVGAHPSHLEKTQRMIEFTAYTFICHANSALGQDIEKNFLLDSLRPEASKPNQLLSATDDNVRRLHLLKE